MSDTVTLPRAEYEALIDARDHAVAMRDIANGSLETLTDEEIDAYLAAPTPLAYWRGRRGLTQVQLAKRAGISQPYVAQMEAGSRTGDVATLAALARVLAVRIEDLVVIQLPAR